MAGRIPLNFGASDDDGTGDSLRNLFENTNLNFIEIFGRLDEFSLVFITQESDFLVQDATTITLESKKIYVLSADVSTAKRFIVQDGVALTGFNLRGFVLTYTGTSAMFTGVDATFYINQISIDCPNCAETYDMSETVGGSKLFLSALVVILNTPKVGTFDKMITVQLNDSTAENADDGISVTGANTLLVSLNRAAFISTDATFKGVDLGSAVVPNLEFSNMLMIAPVGAFGMSGLASSGNVPVGSLAMVSNSSFAGGMTDLENITSTDKRWRFTNNSPTSDTITDALISLNSNATETVISSANVPVKVAGTWVVELESLFECDTTGRCKYIGERSVRLPVDYFTTFQSASGSNKSITVYVAKGNTISLPTPAIITNSSRPGTVSSGAAGQDHPIVGWQVDFEENDFIEVWAENNTDTINLIGTDIMSRVL